MAPITKFSILVKSLLGTRWLESLAAMGVVLCLGMASSCKVESSGVASSKEMKVRAELDSLWTEVSEGMFLLGFDLQLLQETLPRWLNLAETTCPQRADICDMICEAIVDVERIEEARAKLVSHVTKMRRVAQLAEELRKFNPHEVTLPYSFEEALGSIDPQVVQIESGLNSFSSLEPALLRARTVNCARWQ